jgi:chorismate dehydratase
MNKALRIGCVPYLNGKPLIAWFHSPECDSDAEVVYAVPSELARQLREGWLDVALVSTFELIRNPNLKIVPDISIAADGAVKSVRLFSRVPFAKIESVAMDTGSLTSVALARILLKEIHGLSPRCIPHPPNLEAMLSECDAGLIIGDLKLFDTPARYIMDLGAAWKELTSLPFVYAAWLAREETVSAAMTDALTRAKEWGAARLEALAREWAGKMNLPLDRVQDYFLNVMQYDLDAGKWEGLRVFQERCARHGLAGTVHPLKLVGFEEEAHTDERYTTAGH